MPVPARYPPLPQVMLQVSLHLAQMAKCSELPGTSGRLEHVGFWRCDPFHLQGASGAKEYHVQDRKRIEKGDLKIGWLKMINPIVDLHCYTINNHMVFILFIYLFIFSTIIFEP